MKFFIRWLNGENAEVFAYSKKTFTYPHPCPDLHLFLRNVTDFLNNKQILVKDIPCEYDSRILGCGDRVGLLEMTKK